MNPILNKCIESRNGNYCHALEVSNTYELESIIESVYDENINDCSIEDIKEFFNTIQLYHLVDETESDEQNSENENLVSNFDFDQFIDSLN